MPLLAILKMKGFQRGSRSFLIRPDRVKFKFFLHAIHLGEVYYITLREQGQDIADLAYARIKTFPLQYINIIDEKLLRTAARLKAFNPTSYADSFAASLAVIHHAALLTGEPEFKKLEK